MAYSLTQVLIRIRPRMASKCPPNSPSSSFDEGSTDSSSEQSDPPPHFRLFGTGEEIRFPALSPDKCYRCVSKVQGLMYFPGNGSRFSSDAGAPLEVREKDSEIIKNMRRFEKSIIRVQRGVRRNTVRIYGVPEFRGEPLQMRAVNVFSRHMGLVIRMNDILECKREGEGSDRAIVVTFVCHEIKQEVIKRRKNLLGTNIVICSDLPENKLQLLEAALERFGNKCVWVDKDAVICKVSSYEFLGFESYAEFERYTDAGLRSLFYSSLRIHGPE